MSFFFAVCWPIVMCLIVCWLLWQWNELRYRVEDLEVLLYAHINKETH